VKTTHLDRVPAEQTIDLQPDEDGFLGRECPPEGCEKYFKITPGTGLSGVDTCVCPYCGFKEHYSHFHTKAQIDHASSVIEQQVMGALLKDLRGLEFEHKPRGAFGIGLSMRVDGTVPPIRGYSEQELETEVVCGGCTLRFAIYGVFGFCPDCGVSNSLDILASNFALVGKMVDLSAGIAEPGLAAKLLESALGNVVSAFDGWGRALCAAHRGKAIDPARAAATRFQNLSGAAANVNLAFGFDLRSTLDGRAFEQAERLFQKRHLLAHKMGVVDADYISRTGDDSVPIGSKVKFAPADVTNAADSLHLLAAAFFAHLEALP
jgi:hypothetical protein